MKYPIMYLDSEKIQQNAQSIVELCTHSGIQVAGVTKGVSGKLEVAKIMKESGCAQLASSRIAHLRYYKLQWPECETLLLRLPMLCELEDVVQYADISLVSEDRILKQLNETAMAMGKRHQVILMLDLGDLREGYFESVELIEAAVKVEFLYEYLDLAGIGTNLGCYGAIRPTEEKMVALCEAATQIEQKIDRKLAIVSGGATSSLPLVKHGKMPKGINHLRIGEAILLHMDLPHIWQEAFGGCKGETAILEAQILEIKDKPTHPIGEIFVDAFGNQPQYEDRGIQTRAILAVGKQDFAMEDKLIPERSDVTIIGSSSDHLIVEFDSRKGELIVGDTLKFSMFYGPMLHLSTSPYVQKIIV